MFKHNYYAQARLLPTVLSSIPLLVVYNTLVAPLFAPDLQSVFHYLPLITNTIISAAITFLLVQINRLVAKEVFQRIYFKEELYMPSTDYLMWSNNFFSDEIKTNLHQKINQRYNITLLHPNDEANNQTKARKQIVVAVSQIRVSLKGNTMLLQHNIEYGFFRNLIGGSLIAILTSLVGAYYCYATGRTSLFTTFMLLSAVYLVPLLLSKYLINRYGKYYAKILFEQFLTL